MSKANGWLGGENQNKGGGLRETRWLTPPGLVQALGKFDLDPCGAPGHVLADRMYLLEDGEDGLKLPWEGRVWLNPPYNRKVARAFLERLVSHGEGTALLFARTETQTFYETVWSKATGLLFLRGRVTFLDASGTPAKANSGAPSVLVAYGEADFSKLKSSNLPGQILRLLR